MAEVTNTVGLVLTAAVEEDLEVIGMGHIIGADRCTEVFPLPSDVAEWIADALDPYRTGNGLRYSCCEVDVEPRYGMAGDCAQSVEADGALDYRCERSGPGHGDRADTNTIGCLASTAGGISGESGHVDANETYSCLSKQDQASDQCRQSGLHVVVLVNGG